MTRPWWSERWIVCTVIAACALPILVTDVPPLSDLPGHMASYHVALLQEQANPLHRFFSLDWHVIGNLGVDLLMIPAGTLLGVEAGTKVIMLLIPVATASAFFLLAWTSQAGRSPTVFAAVPLVYNYPFLFGFVNYSLSVAMALLAFALWLRWDLHRLPVLRVITFTILAAAVWIAHAIGWLILGVLIGAAELHRQCRAGHRIAALPRALATCLPLLAAVPLNFLSPHSGGFDIHGMFKPIDTAKWLISLLRDRWMIFDLLSVGFLGVIVAAALFKRFGLRIDARLGWPALALLGLYLFLPQSVNDSYFVAGRVAPYVAAITLLAISVEKTSPTFTFMLAAACICFFVFRLTANTGSFILYDRDHREQLVALDHVPRGGTVIGLAQTPCSISFKQWYSPRLHHLTALAVVRRDTFVNATWAIPGLQLLQVHYPAANGFASDPSQLVHLDRCATSWRPTLSETLAALPYDAFQRLWLLDIPRSRWPIDPRLRMLWSTGNSVIYEIDLRRSCAGRRSAACGFSGLTETGRPSSLDGRLPVRSTN